MQVKEKKLENSSMELQIEVPGDRVKDEYKSVFNQLQKEVKIKGFRKGKVPLPIVEQKFKGEADGRVIENVVKKAYFEVIEDKKIYPIGNPIFDFGDKINIGEPFSFKVVLEVPPTVELGKYKNLSAKVRTCDISESDIDSELEALRERSANVSKKGEAEICAEGDMVKLQVKRIDNIAKDEIGKMEFKEYTVVVGKGKKEYSFDKFIIGMKENEEKEVEINYPKKYEIAELAGQKARYLIRIAELSNMELPALDDEFAKDLGEHETLGELRKGIRENIEKYVKDRSDSEAKSGLVKEIVDNSKFEIPESMIQSETDAVFTKFQERFGVFDKDLKEFATMAGINPDDLANRMREEAVANIKSTLVLSEIAKTEELKVSDDEYNSTVKEMAEKHKKTIEEVEKIISQGNMKANIKSEMLLNKALELVYDNAAIKKSKAVSLKEFLSTK